MSQPYYLDIFCKFMAEAKRQNNNFGNDGFKMLLSFDDAPFRRMTSALAHIIYEPSDKLVYRHPHSKRIVQFAFGDSTFYRDDYSYNTSLPWVTPIQKLASALDDLRIHSSPQNAILPHDIVSGYAKLDSSQKTCIEKVLKNMDPSYSIDSPTKNDSLVKSNCDLPKLPIMIIHGGPGTGKTTVLIQIILRAVLQLNKKVLICSSSNVAVDNIGERLLRSFQNYSRTNEKGSFISPPTILRLGSSPKIMNFESLTWKERPEDDPIVERDATTKMGDEKMNKKSGEKRSSDKIKTTKANKKPICYTLDQHLSCPASSSNTNPHSFELLRDLKDRLSTTLKTSIDRLQQNSKLPTSTPRKRQLYTARNHLHKNKTPPIKLNSHTNGTNFYKNLNSTNTAGTNSNASRVNGVLSHHSHQTESEIKRLLSQAEWSTITSADIVLSTLVNFGKYAFKNEKWDSLEEGRFDMLIIDECSQSMEAASWIPMLHAPFCLIAGDHMQLPPTVLSKDPVTKKFLQISLMERLIGMYAKDEPIHRYSFNLYAKKKFLPINSSTSSTSSLNSSSNYLENWEEGARKHVENHFVTRLNRQYRMNERIAKFISNRFYDNLIATPPHVARRVLGDIISNTQYGPLALIDTSGFEHNLPPGNNAQLPVFPPRIPNLMNINPSSNAHIRPPFIDNNNIMNTTNFFNYNNPNFFNAGLNPARRMLLSGKPPPFKPQPVLYNTRHTLLSQNNHYNTFPPYNNPFNRIPCAQGNLPLLKLCSNRADSLSSSSSYNSGSSSSSTGEVSGKSSKANLVEVECVYLHVTRLMNSGLSQSDIGIISPYRLQIEMLNRKLSHKYPDIEIKSVDGYQGKEKEVIILSMVRSNPSGDIGFLQDSRRMNVALTRAKRHLCIVCDFSHYFLRKPKNIPRRKDSSSRQDGYDFLSAFLSYALINGQMIHNSNGGILKSVPPKYLELAAKYKMIKTNTKTANYVDIPCKADKMDNNASTSNKMIANAKLSTPVKSKTPKKLKNQTITKKSANGIAENLLNTHISTEKADNRVNNDNPAKITKTFTPVQSKTPTVLKNQTMTKKSVNAQNFPNTDDDTTPSGKANDLGKNDNKARSVKSFTPLQSKTPKKSKNQTMTKNSVNAQSFPNTDDTTPTGKANKLGKNDNKARSVKSFTLSRSKTPKKIKNQTINKKLFGNILHNVSNTADISTEKANNPGNSDNAANNTELSTPVQPKTPSILTNQTIIEKSINSVQIFPDTDNAPTENPNNLVNHDVIPKNRAKTRSNPIDLPNITKEAGAVTRGKTNNIKSFIVDLHRRVIDFSETPFPGQNSTETTTSVSMLPIEFIHVVKSLENTHLIGFCKKTERSLIQGIVEFEYSLPNKTDDRGTRLASNVEFDENDDEANICHENEGSRDVVEKLDDSKLLTSSLHRIKYTFSPFVLKSESLKLYARSSANKLERCLPGMTAAAPFVKNDDDLILSHADLTLVFEVGPLDVMAEENTLLVNKFAQLSLANEPANNLLPTAEGVNGNDTKMEETRTPKSKIKKKKEIKSKKLLKSLPLPNTDVVNTFPAYDLPHADKIKPKKKESKMEQSPLAVSLSNQESLLLESAIQATGMCYQIGCKAPVSLFGFPCQFSCVAYKFCPRHFLPESHECVNLRGKGAKPINRRVFDDGEPKNTGRKSEKEKSKMDALKNQFTMKLRKRL
ncbi:uncharacterized protein LOC135925387 [Gordionus sp. m RMFG-2023]|uniref:uncharacterized protein LOC135925387 n=1 Tax=Gordionus sp. m RMFG-2023 TaxID=3053472 RepID=UPI0031FC6293